MAQSRHFHHRCVLLRGTKLQAEPSCKVHHPQAVLKASVVASGENLMEDAKLHHIFESFEETCVDNHLTQGIDLNVAIDRILDQSVFRCHDQSLVEVNQAIK